MTLPPHPNLLAPEPGPATLKTRPWGGSRLAALRNAPSSIERPIGESWEFSTMPQSESRCRGRPLAECLGRRLPFLAKLLDTSRVLSLQVHPDDDATTGRLGKEEAWVVLEADREAAVLAGIRPGIARSDFDAAVRRAAADARHGQSLLAMLQTIPVRSGSVLMIPAGTVHAVGAGILMAELQQPVDCTYRLFDYGSDRELHVEAALSATRFECQPTVWQPGDRGTTLRGRHLTLEVLGPGRSEHHATSDHLLVAHGRSGSVIVDGTPHPLPVGELRLVIPEQRYGIEVRPGGGVVVGSIG